MNKTVKKLINDIKNNTYCRLGASKIHGAGIIAIRDIPKNTNPFLMNREEKWLKANIKDFGKLDKGIAEMIDAFFPAEGDGTIYLPDFGLNGINISYFLNTSKKPNVYTTNKGSVFKTLRKIKKGEELTIDYKSYTKI
ncbi:MAG: hypothetical protein US42_C0010G0004 [Candidatus Magasanikbacteria bacterium GW2011_GWC2_37_14]|uniref:SET domain-containing protein n=1 Tax=Candidatus Magasanikbacteria bacterium GW2011_GWC2_37_14 TaxID=1619046 RepID=A0A0G0GBL5_9BACT|nr:MAG: hypothetical protein US42_C0010G0004 [Candidatus Magasanikbacteria bacterium GW2011_GWC2_37_14]